MSLLLIQDKAGQNRGFACLLLFFCLCLLFTSCPEEKNNEDDLYDPRNVTQIDDHIEAAPDIAVDSEGNVHLVYHGTDDYYTGIIEVYYIRSSESGKWSDPINLSNSSNDSRVPQIAIDSEDNIHVIWEEDNEGNGRTMYTMKQKNSTWSEPKYITENGNPLPQLDIDGNNNVHMMGMGYNIVGTYRKNSGGIWGDIEEINYNVNPSMAVSEIGDVHVVRDVQPYPIIYFYKLVGGEWSDNIYVSVSEAHAWVPNVTVDNDRVVYVSWTEKFTNQIKIRMKYLDGTWSEIDSIPNLEGDPWKSKLAVNEQGLHVVWNTHTDEWDYDIYYQMRTHGGEWKERQQISLTSSASLDPGIILIDNILHIAWHEKFEDNKNSNRDIYYTTISVADY